MAKENTSGLNVNSRYGPVAIPDSAGGVIKTEGGKNEMTIELSGKNINDDSLQGDIIIPAGSLVIEAYVEVEEVFVVSGTDPTILVGTNGSEATNGIVISEAIAEAVGTVDITATKTGTWDASFAADTVVGVAIGGTAGPAVTDVGVLRVVVVYVKV